MILPIITSVSREVFRQTPRMQIEAALALGATKWEVVRMTVLPFGRSGVIAASMLGLGRALGETVAVLIILRAGRPPGELVIVRRRLHVRFQDRLRRSEFSEPLPTGAYISAGLALFVLTFLVNAAARAVRRREGQRMTLDDAGKAGESGGVRAVAIRRRIKNTIATVFFLASFLVALVPLGWVLSVVVARGWYAV